MMRLVAGLPLYLYVYRRCQSIRGITGVILATSSEPEDDDLAEHALKNGCEVYRGSLNNVLSRFVSCARAKNVETIVRVCGDSPFLDVQWIGRMIEHFHANKLDYVGWDKEECLPGLDSEIIRLNILEQIESSSPSNEEKEHVTLRIRNNPGLYQTEFYKWEGMIDTLRGMNLTIDTRDDWERASWISRVLEEWGLELRFTSTDVVRVLNHLVTPGRAGY